MPQLTEGQTRSVSLLVEIAPRLTNVGGDTALEQVNGFQLGKIPRAILCVIAFTDPIIIFAHVSAQTGAIVVTIVADADRTAVALSEK